MVLADHNRRATVRCDIDSIDRWRNEQLDNDEWPRFWDAASILLLLLEETDLVAHGRVFWLVCYCNDSGCNFLG